MTDWAGMTYFFFVERGQLVVLLFIAGLIFGSFANVIIYRLPRKQSIIFPPSKCPQCLEPIKPYDNIPLVSFILLRGKCRNCGNKIPVRYPIVELLSGSLFVALYLKLGLDVTYIRLLVFAFGMLTMAFIDLEHKIIPNQLLIALALIGIFLIFFDKIVFFNLFWALGIFFGFFLIAIIRPGGIGFGDVKLSFVIGLYLGAQSLVALFVAFFTGGLISILLLAMQKKSRKDMVPLGPFLAIGSILAIFFGKQVINWYLNLLT